jgi:hypothetical protein
MSVPILFLPLPSPPPAAPPISPPRPMQRIQKRVSDGFNGSILTPSFAKHIDTDNYNIIPSLGSYDGNSLSSRSVLSLNVKFYEAEVRSVFQDEQQRHLPRPNASGVSSTSMLGTANSQIGNVPWAVKEGRGRT